MPRPWCGTDANAAGLRELHAGDPDSRRVIDTAWGLEGLRRQDSIHAAAVVISPAPITEIVPVQQKGEGAEIVTQFEMHAIEELGLLKMSSKRSGRRLRISARMPLPSNWKTPMASPRASMAYTAGSSRGTRSMSGRNPVFSSISSSDRSIVDRLRSPRKSIFSRPSSSMACISNWVTISAPSPFCWTGTISVMGAGEMTTAAAWIES